jgi:hypothetical protein
MERLPSKKWQQKEEQNLKPKNKMKKMMTPGVMNAISNPKKAVAKQVVKGAAKKAVGKAVKKAVGKAVAKKAVAAAKKMY